jgi:hypothetical protein
VQLSYKQDYRQRQVVPVGRLEIPYRQDCTPIRGSRERRTVAKDELTKTQLSFSDSSGKKIKL